MNVYINYVSGNSTDSQGRCGVTNVVIDPNTGAITTALVTIYQFNGAGGSCDNNLGGLIGHEIGHVLGLGDVDWNPSCNGTIMGSSPDFVSSDQCHFVDMEWTEPPEIPPPPAPLPDPGPQCTADYTSPCSPIVINLDAKDDYELTGANSPVFFDMSGTGNPVKIGWTATAENEAFLWLDRNHNGRVTSGTELFGNFTPLKDGQLARNGFEALKELDDNHDGVIDEQDAIWTRLMLWRDLNHNGMSEPNEIAPLAGSGVTAIDLRYHWTGRRDAFGNQFRYQSTVWIENQRGDSRPKSLYDIFFVHVP
jgi:hypothetical protein